MKKAALNESTADASTGSALDPVDVATHPARAGPGAPTTRNTMLIDPIAVPRLFSPKTSREYMPTNGELAPMPNPATTAKMAATQWLPANGRRTRPTVIAK